MRTLLAIAVLPLCVAGCMYAPHSSTTTTTIDGTDVLDSSMRETLAGSAEFACNQSTTGRCYYAVFTSDCRDDAKDTSICTTHRIADFTLATGETRSLDGLPARYKHCVARSAPNPPNCSAGSNG